MILTPSTAELPFLPSQDGFHPKRNQARQKLADRSTENFKNICKGVYYELARRYPELGEAVGLDATAPDATQTRRDIDDKEALYGYGRRGRSLNRGTDKSCVVT